MTEAEAMAYGAEKFEATAAAVRKRLEDNIAHDDSVTANEARAIRQEVEKLLDAARYELMAEVMQLAADHLGPSN